MRTEVALPCLVLTAGLVVAGPARAEVLPRPLIESHGKFSAPRPDVKPQSPGLDPRSAQLYGSEKVSRLGHVTAGLSAS